jgi:hypothetical protein
VKWYHAHPEKALMMAMRASWKRLVGSDFNILLAHLKRTGNACEICGRSPRAVGQRRLAIDHCHATRKFRGTLCNTCNGMLAMSHDDPARLMAGIAYLHRTGRGKTVFND